MFLPPKLTTIVFVLLSSILLLETTAAAQNAEFSRRVAAMQEARTRAQQAPVARVAAAKETGFDYSAPPEPAGITRIARAPQKQHTTKHRVAPSQARSPRQPQRVAQTHSQSNRVASRLGNSGFVPQHVQTAQLVDSTFVDGGSPIISSSVPGCTSCGTNAFGGEIISGGEVISGEIIDGGYIDGGHVDGGYVDDSYIDGGYVDDSCSSCGDGSYFEGCNSCCGRGGCPPGSCWLSGLGTLLRNGEYFGGATAFESSLFRPLDVAGATATSNTNSDDSSNGFFGGYNLGVPLCRLTGGVLSGQVGIRSVNTTFNGNEFTTDDRDQLFVTAGFYRRVDYGFQFGVVADLLHEEWFTTTDLVQIRGDLGWVYPSGWTFGFRFANNVQDDADFTGTINGTDFSDSSITTEDTYRFYFRRDQPSGGYGEAFGGWSEGNQGIVGLQFDMPLGERVAMQSGFTYFLNDDNQEGFLGGNPGEAFNIYLGLAFRPRGRAYYNSYDRPLFDVADNGSLLITREAR